jgi:mycofactocin biosynthesis protein MftB
VRGLLTVPVPASSPGTSDGLAPQRSARRSASSSGAFDPGRAWRLHPQVAVRPEPFGALLYHFGTRKLSFLKNQTILAVVQSLTDYPDVRTACRAAGVDDALQRPYLHALGVLAGSNMLVPAGPEGESCATAR